MLYKSRLVTSNIVIFVLDIHVSALTYILIKFEVSVHR